LISGISYPSKLTPSPLNVLTSSSIFDISKVATV
jgi:hypothetical protein